MGTTFRERGPLLMCVSVLILSACKYGVAEERTSDIHSSGKDGDRGFDLLPGDEVITTSPEMERLSTPVPEDDTTWSSHEFQIDQGNQSTTQRTFKSIDSASTTVVPSPIIHSHCEKLLKKLGETASHFTRCSILHARPLGLCSGCMYEYTDFGKVFDAITKEEDPTTGEKSCAEVLLASDMTQIVVKTHQFIQSLWEASTCEQCFDIGPEVNGTVSYSLSNNTLHFQEMANKTILCFAQHTNKTGGVSDVCTACKKPYDKLNDLYISLKDTAKLCVDIVDSMNSTRHTWSHRFMCLKREQDTVAVAAIAVGLCILPVFFYIGSKINVEKIEKKLLKQKRFRPLDSASVFQ
ncbi:PREDICTED: osteopetrosis-associated transmembrane protein 1-like [Branchiostoma belcheri]|uniref:Osteopetrosis-associated transmembrane protein 1-like n=1 Tax=Branchiostoma belcheri TaxID=7741 RepID=A0A6P4ZXE7_BRABE|nr:PREDICTED: osteopetrosis-associated transmembrane protein 1-like [Branchiostoma belcheri]